MANNQVTTAPTQIGRDHDWMEIAAGDVHAIALKRNGTLWAWGDNSMDQLGNGPGPNQSSPVQVGTDHTWRAISCGQGSHALALRADGSLWVWGTIFGFENGKPGVVLPTPIQVCRETNWIGLVAGPVVRALARSGTWAPLESPPTPDADVHSVCRLISSNSVVGSVAFAFCGRPELYEVRSDGTLRARTYPIGPWAKARNRDWRQVGRRTDWVSIWGSGTALGCTADGTLWTWGSDPSQEPIPDLRSRYKLLEAQVLTSFGFPPSSITTSATSPYQKEPRPLLRWVLGAEKKR